MAFVPIILPIPMMMGRSVYRQQPMYYTSYGGGLYGTPYGAVYRRGAMHYGGLAYPVNAVVLGPLPAGFLTLEPPAPSSADPAQTQEEADHALAARLQRQGQPRQLAGRLEVTVVRATLNKNYGLVRMDPYVRLHFGQQVFETQTDINGAKNPVWNKTFYIYQLPPSFQSFHLEVYDERTLSDDERVCWLTVSLPDRLRQGESSDKWYPLSGRMGEGLEGSIYILMSYTVGPSAAPVMMYGDHPTVTFPRPAVAPAYPLAVPGVVQPGTVIQPPPVVRPAVVTDEDVKQVASLFPNTEEAVVRSVLEASQGCKEAAVEALLGMQA